MTSRAQQKKALADLAKNRAAGKTRLSSYEVKDREQVYEEVDEEGYKKLVRSRLDQDDFVIDDNGEGYADDGREDWAQERGRGYDSESEEEMPLRGKAGESMLLTKEPRTLLTSITHQVNGNVNRTRRRRTRSRRASASSSVRDLWPPSRSQRYVIPRFLAKLKQF